MHLFGRKKYALSAMAYRILPEDRFEGQSVSYSERIAAIDAVQIAIEFPLGPYHGMQVRHRQHRFVLCGPETIFLPDESTKHSREESAAAVQLVLF